MNTGSRRRMPWRRVAALAKSSTWWRAVPTSLWSDKASGMIKGLMSYRERPPSRSALSLPLQPPEPLPRAAQRLGRGRIKAPRRFFLLGDALLACTAWAPCLLTCRPRPDPHTGPTPSAQSPVTRMIRGTLDCLCKQWRPDPGNRQVPHPRLRSASPVSPNRAAWLGSKRLML
jgi:hypothetical protein